MINNSQILFETKILNSELKNMLIVTFPMQGSTSAIDVPDLSRHCLDLACDSPTMHSSEHGLHVDQGDQLLFAFL